MTPPKRACSAINMRTRDVCGKPAKAALLGNSPVCGVHARAAEMRGEAIYPLQEQQG